MPLLSLLFQTIQYKLNYFYTKRYKRNNNDTQILRGKREILFSSKRNLVSLIRRSKISTKDEITRLSGATDCAIDTLGRRHSIILD